LYNWPGGQNEEIEMKAFIGFVRKEMFHILRDTRSMVILFGMPIIMLVLFGFAIRNEVDNVGLAVLDRSQSQISRQVIQTLDQSDEFDLKGRIDSEQQIEGLFKKNEIKLVLVFPEDLVKKVNRGEQAQVEAIADATDPNMAQLSVEYARAHLGNYQQIELSGGAEVQRGGVWPVSRMLYNPTLESVNLFVPGLIAVILMLVSALMTSISITREKETGSMEVLLISPLRPMHIILGKVMPYLVLSFINVMMVLILADLVFHVPFRGSPLLFLLESTLYIVVALALGVFISTKANNQQTAMMVALAGLLLPTVILSGFIFPISSMPVPLQYLSHLFPAKWFLIIVKSIMLKGSTLAEIGMETGILSAMALLFIGLSIKNFNERLERV
jgi:ABC-2 type transport system permease protein